MFLVTARQMSRMDKNTIEEYGIPGAVLMENAGRGATRILLSKFGNLTEKKIGIVAGSGNNGGDGFVIARYLAEHGYTPEVFLLGSVKKVKGDAALNLDLLSELNIPVTEITDQETFAIQQSAMLKCGLWVDAIFGIGLNADITGFFKTVIELINQTKKPVLSIDIPSGLHPDTGLPQGISIKADVTATFGYAKTGLVTFPGIDYCGCIEIVDIGIPKHIEVKEALSTQLLTPEKISACYRPRNSNEHKGTTGHLLVFAGSTGKTGAAALTSQAAARTGSGLVTLCTPESVNPVLETLLPEVMTIPLPESKNGELSKQAYNIAIEASESKNCITAGPGLGTLQQTRELINTIITLTDKPIVLDADALNIISKDTSVLKKIKGPAILTPHPKEMERLTGLSVTEIQKNRVKAAGDFAKRHGVYLILKGARTIIAHPDGQIFINPTGNPSMASGGMGDVLTGMISGFLAQGYPVADSTHMGVYLHGAAADILSSEKGPIGITASDVVNEIPRLINMMAQDKLAPLKNTGYWF